MRLPPSLSPASSLQSSPSCSIAPPSSSLSFLSQTRLPCHPTKPHCDHSKHSKAGCVDRAAVPPSPDHPEWLASRLRCVQHLLIHVCDVWFQAFWGWGLRRLRYRSLWFVVSRHTARSERQELGFVIRDNFAKHLELFASYIGKHAFNQQSYRIRP